MDKSIFSDKAKTPTAKDLTNALANTHDLWQAVCDLTLQQYPKAISEWNFSGEKYGWSFRIKDKKRAIVYLLPRDKFFKAAFVFGQKAFEEILQSNISEGIKTELQAAKVYAEGRGIRLEVRNKKIMEDISQLIRIKLAH